MKIITVILLITLYLWVCKKNYVNLTKICLKDNSKNMTLSFGIAGAMLTIILTVFICWLSKPIDLITAVVTYTIVSLPYYIGFILGAMRVKNPSGEILDTEEG